MNIIQKMVFKRKFISRAKYCKSFTRYISYIFALFVTSK